MKRIDELNEIINKLTTEQKTVIQPLIDDIVFMESRLSELRKLPQIRVHPKDVARQQVTPAGKQYKETMQAYLNAIKVVLTAFNREDTDAADELLEKLKEFEL